MFTDKSDFLDNDTDECATDTTEATQAESSTQAENTGTPEQETIPEPQPRKRHGFRRFMTILLLLIVIALSATVYIRYFNPYVTDAVETGLVLNVERRGILFKTFEAEIAPIHPVTAAPREYTRANYSVANDSIALLLQSYQRTGIPVAVTYSHYFGTLPWRGASKSVITGVTVQPSITEP